MNYIKQRKFKSNFRSITESSASISQENLQQKIRSLRENRVQLQEYKPLKSQIICIGSTKEQNNDVLKKKRYRYLRFDTSKDEENSKSLSKSISKSKTTSTESLRVHKIRSITHQIQQKDKNSDRIATIDQTCASRSRLKQLAVISNAYECKTDKQGKIITEIKDYFQILDQKMKNIHTEHKQSNINKKKKVLDNIIVKNKQIGIKIITKIFLKMVLSHIKDSFLLMIV